jgi:subtilase family serine protease
LDNIQLDGTSNTPNGNDNEVSLDIEMVIAMAPGINQVNIYEGTSDVDIMNEIVSPTQGEPLPNQVSCSFGIGGDTSLETQLTEMAMQGQTFFYASGDGGAPKEGTNSSPQDDNYLTSVGGTELSMNGSGASWQSEQVWDFQFANGASYGAVVTSDPIPAYQSWINMSLNQGSTIYRNIPDVAMVADYILVVDTKVFTNGNPPKINQVGGIGGTSAASPLWAGFTALVNQQAAAQGKAPVGFLNPAIYNIAMGPLYNSCFHDIVVGNSTNANNPTEYFAQVGYDLCTGWGTPTGANLINALVGLTGPVFVDFNYTGSLQNGTFYAPYKTLEQGTNAVTPGGTIFIKTAGSSTETMTITKSMTITAIDGPDDVGQ